VARAAERDAQAIGDITQRELLEAHQLEGGALPLGQLCEAGAKQPASFLPRQQRPRAVRCGGADVEELDRLAAVGGAPLQIGLAAQGSVVGVLEQPPFDAAARRIVEVGLAGNLEEHFLGDVLRFRGIAEDVGGHALDQAAVSAEQRVEGVAVGGWLLARELRPELNTELNDELGVGRAVFAEAPSDNGGAAMGGVTRREDAHAGYPISML